MKHSGDIRGELTHLTGKALLLGIFACVQVLVRCDALASSVLDGSRRRA